VGLESKERPVNGIFGVLPVQKWGESQKKKEGVGNSLLPNPTETLATQATLRGEGPDESDSLVLTVEGFS